MEYLLDQSVFSSLYNWGTNILHARFKGIKYNPNRLVGVYNAVTGFLELKSNDEISSCLEEEIIHMFQDYIYGGIKSCAIPNIEFEAKLIRDIGETIAKTQGTIGGYGQTLHGENPKGKLSNECPLWINYLTNYGTKFPTYDEVKAPFNGYDYWEFMYDFTLLSIISPLQAQKNRIVKEGDITYIVRDSFTIENVNNRLYKNRKDVITDKLYII